MTLTTNWLQAIDGTNALAATIRYSLHGFAREATPADAGSIAFEETAPVRKFPDYVQNTGKFHLNAGLYEDFYFDHTMTYETADRQAAEAAILSGVGLRDERSFVHILARYRRDPDALAPETVFGAFWTR